MRVERFYLFNSIDERRDVSDVLHSIRKHLFAEH